MTKRSILDVGAVLDPPLIRILLTTEISYDDAEVIK